MAPPGTPPLSGSPSEEDLVSKIERLAAPREAKAAVLRYRFNREARAEQSMSKARQMGV
jgi:hypothetical protein